MVVVGSSIKEKEHMGMDNNVVTVGMGERLGRGGIGHEGDKW